MGRKCESPGRDEVSEASLGAALGTQVHHDVKSQRDGTHIRRRQSMRAATLWLWLGAVVSPGLRPRSLRSHGLTLGFHISVPMGLG